VSEFYIRRDGKEFGPYPANVLVAAIARGKVQSTDLVRAEGTADWVPAATAWPEPAPATAVVGAAAGAGAAAAAAVNPYRAPTAPVEVPSDDDLPYGGFWARFAAAAIDGLVLWVPAMLLSLIPLFGFIASTVLSWLYYAKMESGERGATLGKRALKLQVVSADDGGQIGFGRATGRYFGRYVSMLILGIGYLMQPFTARKQTLHDMMSDTVVVAREPAPTWLIVVAVGLFAFIPVLGVLAAVSIPAYQDYTVRAKIAQAMIETAPAKAAVGKYIEDRDQVPRTLSEASYTFAPTERVDSISIDGRTAVLTVSLAFQPVQGETILYVPARNDQNGILWTCRPGTVKPRYLPASCRGGGP
jgi:uncharacterized RDD family membrane protein YckC/Tfp pilus assembly major pilin PilA